MKKTHLIEVAKVESGASEFPWSISNFESSLNAGHLCLTLLCEGNVVAHTVISKILDEAEILIFTVSKGVQGCGVGLAFLQSIHDHVLHDVKKIFLEVRESNSAAFALYSRCAYVKVATRKNYYKATKKAPSENALILVREISPI